MAQVNEVVLVTRDEVVGQLKSLIEEGEQVLSTSHTVNGIIGGPWVNSKQYDLWRAKSLFILREILPVNQQGEISRLEEKSTSLTSLANKMQSQLKSALSFIQEGIISVGEGAGSDTDELIQRVLSSFPDVIDSLRRRHSGRPSIDITDEYDVQDILRSIYKSLFRDVRDEESVPSFAGKNSRVDLFLKDECRFIEVKMTRKGLEDKRIGEELAIDIPQYREHPGCAKLYCFVYDPERRLKNPTGLINDLESVDPGFVKVVVSR